MDQIDSKQIGERVTFSKSKERLHVAIHQRVPAWQTALLGLWLAGWTFCGVVFLYFLAQSQTQGEHVMMLICVAVWAYFEFRVGRVLLWRLKGVEHITIRPGELEIRNALLGKGKANVFKLQHVHKFTESKESTRNFLAFLDNSFWIMGGDRFQFTYLDKTYLMGKYLSDKDVRSLKMVFDKALRQFAKSGD